MKLLEELEELRFQFIDYMNEEVPPNGPLALSLQVYSRRPIKGITFFKDQLPLTIGVYCWVAGFTFITIVRDMALWTDGFSNFMEFMCLWVALGYSAGMAILKYWIMKRINEIDLRMPKRNLRILTSKTLRKRLYIFNIKYSSINLMVFFLLLIYSSIVLLYTVLIKQNFPRIQLLLISIAPLIRHFFLVGIFNKTFRNSAEGPGTGQLSEDEINPFLMEEFVFTPELKTAFPQLEHQNECIICQLEYEEGDKLLQFSCKAKHFYHLDCLSRWLTMDSKCPMCKETAV